MAPRVPSVKTVKARVMEIPSRPQIKARAPSAPGRAQRPAPMRRARSSPKVANQANFRKPAR